MRTNATGWGRMIAAVALALGLFGLAQAGFAQETDKNKVRYWLERYGEYQGPLRERIDEVFEKVAAAADKRADRYPKFAPIEKDGDPYAVALPDGGIVLTKTALDLCYPEGESTGPEGDAKLAFVLGHELSHLATVDFAHQEMFDLAQHFMGAEDRVVAQRRLIGERPNLSQVELRADSYGLMYATLAGYRAGLVIQGGGTFFGDWTRQIYGLSTYVDIVDGHRPTPAERVVFLKAKMEEVAALSESFDVAMRLYHVGRYVHSLDLLDRVATRFPGRAVWNNVGVSHYQLAAAQLASCDGALLIDYLHPSAIAMDSRLRLMLSTPKGASCLTGTSFLHHWEQAKNAFSRSIDADETYVQSYVNLMSALNLSRRWSEAVAVSAQAKRAGLRSAALDIAGAIALFNFSREARLGDWRRFASLLEPYVHKEPAASYNLGTMLRLMGKREEAAVAYSRFLDMYQARDFYLSAARAWTNQEEDARVEAPHAATPAPAVAVGQVKPALVEILQALPVTSAHDDVRIYETPTLKVVRVGDSVVLVEESVSQDARKRFGAPRRRIESATGELAIYNGFALAISRDGENTTLIHWAEEG